MARSTVGQTRSAPCLAELQAWLEASPALLSVKLPADAIQYTLTRDVGDGGQSMLGTAKPIVGAAVCPARQSSSH